MPLIVDATLTEAHHHLGDLLFKVRQGKVVRIINGTRNQVAAYLVPPRMLEETIKELEACEPAPSLTNTLGG